MMNENRIIDILGQVEEQYIWEAAPETDRKRSKRKIAAWAAAAACLSLVIVGMSLFINRSDETYRVYAFESMEELTSVCGDTLLAGKIPLTDAGQPTIELSYLPEGSPQDRSSWDTLSVSVDYPDYSLNMECSFDGEGSGAEAPEAGCRTVTRGDTVINIYQGKPVSKYEYEYYAIFEYQGVSYRISTLSDDADRIDKVIDAVFGISPDLLDESPQSLVFAEVMGYDSYRVKVVDCGSGIYSWRYYAQGDDEEICIGEFFGSTEEGWEPEAFLVDIDHDGMTELIGNCTYGDGERAVVAYRNHNGVIEQGGIGSRLFEQEFGMDITGGVGTIVKKYLPEENVVLVTNYTRDGRVLTEKLRDLEHYFSFWPFVVVE